jgi:hypothetical protein
LKIKLKGRHIDTTEMIEEESQALLKTSQNTLPGCISKWKKCWEWCIGAEGDYFKAGQ